MTYEQLLAELRAEEDPGYRAFHKRLLKEDALSLIGVRMPVLRAIARRHRGEWRDILTFPNEYYEVGCVQCAVVALLPFDTFCTVVDDVVGRIDNWATCDMFAPACVGRNREAFKPWIRRYLADERVFVRRFALTTLLHFYVREEELPFLFSCLARVDTSAYYVSMAAAWLTAEIVVKWYETGIAFLQKGVLSAETGRRAVRKACESFRLTAEQKAAVKACLSCHKKL